VQHALSMDTGFPETTIRYRAVTSPSLQQAAYAAIIAGETITALLCGLGVVGVARHISVPGATFKRLRHAAARQALDGRLLLFRDA
jgi:predicted small integral membrane protein